MQEETQQFSQMDMEGNLMVRISCLLECFVKKNKNLHCRIVLFPKSNIIHIVGYRVQAGPNNGQQSNGTKSFKEEVMVHEHTVPHTHRSFNSNVFFVWQVTVLEVTADNQPKATVLTLSSCIQ